MISTQGHDRPIGRNRQEPGQEIDLETNLYHFPARYYEPYWGRFLTPDPWTGMPDDERNLAVQHYAPRSFDFYTAMAYPRYRGAPMSVNKSDPRVLNSYLYVINNPVKYLDIYGLWFDKDECDTYEDCYEKCINSAEVLATQQLATNIRFFTGLFGGGASAGLLLLGVNAQAVAAGNAMAWFFNWSFYDFTGPVTNLYCYLSCTESAGQNVPPPGPDWRPPRYD